MWSKRIGVLSVLAVLVFSAAAFAAVQDFKDFTVDVPDDWTATQNGTTVGIVANDNSAAVSVTVDKLKVIFFFILSQKGVNFVF